MGVLALIFWDNIDTTAKRLDVDASLLMGRVMAHEIGHLLGMRRHSKVGLMRKYWSDDLLRRGRDLDFRFRRDEAAALDDGTDNMHRLAPLMIPAPRIPRWDGARKLVRCVPTPERPVDFSSESVARPVGLCD